MRSFQGGLQRVVRRYCFCLGIIMRVGGVECGRMDLF